MIDPSVGFVGAGQMAQALARGIVDAGLVAADKICAFDPDSQALTALVEAVPGASSVQSNRDVVQRSQTIVLAVKPQVMEAVFIELQGQIPPSKLVVSVAAGVTLHSLMAGLGTERVIRVMPNTPCLVRQGASGFATSAGVSQDDARWVAALLGAVGLALPMPEPLLDVATGLSGSGPAYVFMAIDALADGAVRMGMPRPMALELATQTVLGAARMLQATGQHPAVLRDRVTSPGGTTIAGIQALEDHQFRSALMAAVQAATLRSIELGQGQRT
jgi:pyrroline-5-carboxylate reductase